MKAATLSHQSMCCPSRPPSEGITSPTAAKITENGKKFGWCLLIFPPWCIHVCFFFGGGGVSKRGKNSWILTGGLWLHPLPASLVCWHSCPIPAAWYSRGPHYRDGPSSTQGDWKPNLWWCHAAQAVTRRRDKHRPNPPRPLANARWLLWSGAAIEDLMNAPDMPGWHAGWTCFLWAGEMCHLSEKEEEGWRGGAAGE